MKTLTNTTAEVANKIFAKIAANSTANKPMNYSVSLYNLYPCGCVDNETYSFYNVCHDEYTDDIVISETRIEEFYEPSYIVLNNFDLRLEEDKIVDITAFKDSEGWTIIKLFIHCDEQHKVREQYTKELYEAADEYSCIVADNGICDNFLSLSNEEKAEKTNEEEQAKQKLIDAGAKPCFIEAVYNIGDQIADAYPGHHFCNTIDSLFYSRN